MAGSDARTGRWRRARWPLVCLLSLVAAPLARAQSQSYTPKNGVLNWKAILLGGGFRVTTAIPLHGDFSHYDRLEIVQTESLIGPDVPPDLLIQVTQGLAAAFRHGGRFAEVSIVDRFTTPGPPPVAAALADLEDFRNADPLDAPMRPGQDVLAVDRRRTSADPMPASASTGTLLVCSQVIDYAKGHKVLQLLFLDLGNAILTLRVSYVDKQTGEERGRSVISSDTSSKIIPSVLSPRSAVSGVVEGLVDQTTRRKVAAER
jgi:hypothetical protein